MRMLFDWVKARISHGDTESSVFFTVNEDDHGRCISVQDEQRIPLGDISYPDISPGLIDVEKLGLDGVIENCKTAISLWLPR